METIKSIKHHNNFEIDRYPHYEGYEVLTNKRSIKIGVTNEQDCCEVFGSISDNDEDLDYFVGKELLSIDYVEDGSYKKSPLLLNKFEGAEPWYVDCAFMNINTNGGPFQLAVYNDHNGYYGHTVKVEVKDL